MQRAKGQVRVDHLGKGQVIGALQQHGEGESIESIGFFGDLLTGGTDGTDGKIHISTLRLQSSLLGREDAITSLNAHGDGQATSVCVDSTLGTWDIRSGKEGRVCKAHAAPASVASIRERV